jgi:syntaxin 18
MDITAVFKACLETVRQRNKELAFLNADDPHGSSGVGAMSKIFPRKKSEYFAKARELSATITSLRDFLQENRNAYLNIGASLSVGKAPGKNSVFTSPSSKKVASTTSTVTMTDLERDQIDSDVQKIVQNCQRRIMEFERMLETTDSIKNNPHLCTHLESIVTSLGNYLKEVTLVYSEMKAIRVKRTVDHQAMSRLAALPSMNKKKDNNSSSLPSVLSSLSSSSKGPKKGERSLSVPDGDDGPEAGTSSSSVPDYFLDEEIPPEELQILEEENRILLNELNSLANEVDQIQSSVVQIAQLQEIFTEKVLLQDKEIESLANVVVKTTENIKGGNEQIRQAIQKNADFRVWVLFFILVMSFSLLFLDWYNE